MAPSRARKSSPTGTPAGQKVSASSRWVQKPKHRRPSPHSTALTTAAAPSRSTRLGLAKTAAVVVAAADVAALAADAGVAAAVVVAAAASAAAAVAVAEAVVAAAAIGATVAIATKP